MLHHTFNQIRIMTIEISNIEVYEFYLSSILLLKDTRLT